MTTKYTGLFQGWAKQVARAAAAGVEVEMATTSLLGQPRIELRLKKTAEAAAAVLTLTAINALGLGAAMLCRAATVTGLAPQPLAADLAEDGRVELACAAAYLLARLGRDGGKSRESTEASIEHVLLGWLWNPEHPGQIAANAVRAAWGRR